jgi:hypothetical protein
VENTASTVVVRKRMKRMDNIRDAAMGFEAVKVSMSQDRNGIILRLNVHPNDCPPELHTDWVGTRYMVAMVRLNDEEEPETREEFQRVERLIASAGLLCRNPEFGEYLHDCGLIEDIDPFKIESAAVAAVRKYCGIESRSEFRSNPDARSKFEKLREDFRQWKKN